MTNTFASLPQWPGKSKQLGAIELLAVALLLAPISLQAQVCQQWEHAGRSGELPPQLRESSGLAVSAAFPDRLYHINDSGDAGRFFVTALDGTRPQAISIVGFDPLDTEALSLGPCAGLPQSACVYVGDIGDNRRERKAIEVVAVEETASFAASVPVRGRWTLRYPDGAHDAEGMAVHPDGTLFILTKEHPARLYKARLDKTEPTLEVVTTLAAGSPPTDMAISDDGRRLLVLTYLEAFEFSMDFKEERRIAIAFLQQQESVAYLPGARSFIYSTERPVAKLLQPILRMDCTK